MKVASISQTKNNLRAYIDMVRHGETVLIMDRNQPVARLEPVIQDKSVDPAGRLSRLERAGVIHRPLRKPNVSAIVGTPPPRAKAGISVLKALLEERAEGR